MTIEEQIASIDRVLGAVRASVSDLERNLGTKEAFPAAIKLVGAMNELDSIKRRKSDRGLMSVEEILGAE